MKVFKCEVISMRNRITALFIALSVLICALAPSALASGELRIDPTGRSIGYSAVVYDNTNGLPTAEANCIAETSEGFIWIGGYSGLIRYDGLSFERYDSTTGIASVVSLFVDSRDRLWVGTNDSGIGCIERGELRMWTKHDGLGADSVRAITEKGSRIYIATTQGVSYIEEDSMTLCRVDESRINEEYIRDLKVGAGFLYGVTMDGEVFMMDEGGIKAYFKDGELGIEGVRTVLPDAENPGYVWFGGKNEEIYYGKLTFGGFEASETAVTTLNFINSIEYIGGYLWVCADNGVGYIKDGEFMDCGNIGVYKSVEHVMADYQGNLWMTSSQQGVLKLVPNRFKDVFAEYFIPDEVVYSTCLYDGKLFVGTKSSGLMVIDNGYTVGELPLESAVSASGEALADFDLLNSLNGTKIRSIIRDSRNTLWISTFGDNALTAYDGNGIVRYTEADGLPSNRVRTVFERADGSILVACTGGVAVIENGRVTKTYGEEDGLYNIEILTVCETESGEILAGSDGGGIYVISDSGVKCVDTDTGLKSDVVMRIKKDRFRDIYWIVTSNSIAYMNASHAVTNITKFPYSNNFDLYENSSGEMWVLSSNGVYVLSADELIRNGEIKPQFYNRYNGLPVIATANSYSELTEDGTLYISGTTGVAEVNIEKEFDTVEDVKFSVPYLSADGTVIYPDENGVFTVPSSCSKLTIYGFVYNYSLVNPTVHFRLDGFDKTENVVLRSEMTPVDYTNLPGGDYDFVMELFDSRGKSGGIETFRISKQLRIREMMWYQIMRVVLLIAVIVGLSFIYFRRKAKAYEKRNEEQKTFIREMIEAFAKTIDMKDKYTNGHSGRVAKYTVMLAKELGYDDETVEKYYNIALLHDIGKIGIPEEVLNKPGKLTDDEYKIIQSHAQLGYNVLKDISIMPELATGAGCHHERPDGKGYPRGLKLEEIPRVAQIIAVADTFDAMYSTRPYRKRMNFDKVVSIIKEVSGTQLTPDVVDAFLRLAEKGVLKAPDDDGGGSTEDINNIHEKQIAEEKA